MKTIARWATLAAVIASTACAADAADLSHRDKRYLDKTAEGLMSEISLGQMAQKQAESPDVQAFGKRMVNDHGKDLEQLKQIATQKGATLPDSSSRKQKKEADKLSRMTGKDFDREYVKYELKDHKEDVKDQAREMKDSSDADLKTFATAAHATVTGHYKMVADLNGKVGK